MKKILLPSLFFAGAMFGSSTAQAAIVFEFEVIVAGAPQGGPTYARLTITNAALDTVTLLLENTATMPDADGQSIHRLHLNVDPFVSDFDLTSADPKFEDFNLTEDGQNDSGSMFDLQINFDIAPPVDRFLPGGSALMTATGTGLTEDSFTPMSAGDIPRQAMIHLISIPPNEDSAKVTTVPEPATFAALGLGALALLRRRKKA
ncbi:MAG: PEP-CTERM sorting domain-containing protein [Fimbriimonadaceae bacterium]